MMTILYVGTMEQPNGHSGKPYEIADLFHTILHHCLKTATQKGWYDFFLVCQHVHRGMIPTHYNVVYNNLGVKPAHMHAEASVQANSHVL